MKWLASIITDDDWDTDGVLVAVIFTILFTCFLQWKSVANFDPEKFGQGIGYILGGGGLGYCAKRIAEKRGYKDGMDGDSLDIPKS